MALDSGIHAGMTAFLARRNLCITMRSPAWEPLSLQAPAGLFLGKQELQGRIPKLELGNERKKVGRHPHADMHQRQGSTFGGKGLPPYAYLVY